MSDHLAEAPWQELSERAILRWRLQILGYGAGAAGAAGLVLWLFVLNDTIDLRVLASALALVGVATLVIAAVWPVLAYRRWRYRLADDALELERGVVVRRRSSVPYGRVQQIDVNRGPIDRIMGLSVARLLTASAGTDGSVPGLTPEAAESFRRLVLQRAGRDDAV